MKTQPLIVILAVFAASVALLVGCAIALKMTDTPISLVAGLCSVLGGAIVALVGRTTVFSPASAEKLVTKALETEPPPSKSAAEAKVAEIVGSPP